MILAHLFKIIWITLTITFGGEPAVISLSFASAMDKISLVVVIVAGYLTAVIGEVAWFSIVRKLSPGKVRKWKFIKKSYDAYSRAISKVERRKPLKLLFWARSFYGGGMAAIVYLAGTQLGLKKLIKYSLIVNAFWTALSVLVGWEAGKGFRYALHLFVDIRITITILAVSVAVIYSAFYILKRMFNKN